MQLNNWAPDNPKLCLSLLRHPIAKFFSVRCILLGGGRSQHFMKLRPGVEEFLQKASAKFELTLYTHGRREYALQVARTLDPSKALFAGRLVSTPDDVPDLTSAQQKSLTRLFPGGAELALVMDDRDDVWDHGASPNVLLVRPYRYFGRAAEGTEDRDPQLSESLALLERVHERFFAQDDSTGELPRSAADILGEERRAVLAGCRFVFSGVFPLGVDPARSREAAWVRRLGGTIVSSPSSATHCVGRNPGTAKVQEAVARRLHVVHLDWLW